MQQNSLPREHLSRRSFLSLATAGALGTFSLSSCTEDPKSSMATTATEPANIALQLWTVRDALEQDVEGTLRRVAEMGYPAVETAFFPENISFQQAGLLLKEVGLSVCSIHCELPVDEKSKSDMLAMAEAYNCQRMVWHGWPEDARYKTADGTQTLIDVYHESLNFAQSNGLQFGLHNHWWEFEEHEPGHTPFMQLLDQLDKDIFFELDTYWIKVAGQDPAEIVGLSEHRAPLLHIKDGPAKWNDAMDKDEPEPMVAVGQGILNFPDVVTAANGHTEWMIVELDNCATDMMTAVAESYTYLTSNGLAKGLI